VAGSMVAKEMLKAAMFNARIETADTSGAFKDAFASHAASRTDRQILCAMTIELSFGG
jgi:hypothetical protein